MGLVIGAGGEEDRVRWPVVGGAVAELQRPEPVDHERPAVPGAELAGVGVGATGARLLGVDRAVAEFADQQVAAEATEVAGSAGDAPPRVQLAAAGDPRKQRSVAVEGIDEPEALPVDVVLALGVLLVVGDEDAVADRLDPEGSEAAREVGVDE